MVRRASWRHCSSPRPPVARPITVDVAASAFARRDGGVMGSPRAEPGSVLRHRRQGAGAGSIRALHRDRNQALGLQQRLHREGSRRPRVERQVSSRGSHRNHRVPHPLGDWLSPAACLLRAELERQQGDLAESTDVGAVPREEAGPPWPRCQDDVVVLPESVRRHAAR